MTTSARQRTPMELKIKYRKPEDLIPYVNNAKTHGEAQITALAASITEYGFNNPVLLDGESGVIAGHGRLLAAAQLGLESIPTIDLSHLSGARKQAYILADNKLSEFDTGWDMALLQTEVEAIDAAGLEVEVTGFSMEDFLVTADELEVTKGMSLEPTPPEDFQPITEIELAHKCPKCGYEFDD